MSPCCGSVCLLVLLGIVVASGIPVPHVCGNLKKVGVVEPSGNPGQYVSENLRNAHKSIADVLGLEKQDIGSNPLFRDLISSINTSCQRKQVMMMNATLDVYMRIFSSILQHNHGDKESDPKIKSDLQKLKKSMETLKTHLPRPCHDENEDVISKLNEIKVDDLTNQKKALAEFLEIYQMASVIGYRHAPSA